MIASAAPRGGTADLRAGFLRSAALHPVRPALWAAGRELSYAETLDWAGRWATALLERTRGRPRRVGVVADRSPASYVGVMASLLAGAAFVPISVRLPPSRIRRVVELADLDAIIAGTESIDALHALLGTLEAPPTVVPASAAAATTPASPVEVAPDDPAYLLFTSGSAGEPKGVPITHANVRAFLDANADRYGLTPEDRLTQTFDQTFDLSVFDLFMAWEAGASVHVLDPIELLAPAGFVERHAITVWFSVPSVGTMLLRRGALAAGSMPSLRWSLFCGEALPRSLAEAWQEAAPASTIENLYGPTELTIACAAYRWDPAVSPRHCTRDIVPIGEVYDHLHAVIVDGAMREVPKGEAGELCVAGAQALSGYWRAPEQTQRSFLTRREPDGEERRYYRTGDVVRRGPGGLAYLGRGDDQVKIRGHRIELGEIEAVLRRSGCVDAVALPWPDATMPTGIVAIVTGGADPATLRTQLRDRLPAPMLPREIRVLDQMPLTGNGKIDRRALRERLREP